MATDVSWRDPASRYADLYRSLVELPHEVELPQEKVA
jgi:glycogen synthase